MLHLTDIQELVQKVSDLILPSTMIYENGWYGNAERRTQLWRQQVVPVGDAMSDTWQWVELSKKIYCKRFMGRANFN